MSKSAQKAGQKANKAAVVPKPTASKVRANPIVKTSAAPKLSMVQKVESDDDNDDHVEQKGSNVRRVRPRGPPSSTPVAAQTLSGPPIGLAFGACRPLFPAKSRVSAAQQKHGVHLNHPLTKPLNPTMGIMRCGGDEIASGGEREGK
jgi:hypothetical protein